MWQLSSTLVCLSAALWTSTSLLAVERHPPKVTSAQVEGRVIYRPDPKRRWRYARYYVKDRRQGFLAEAVVELRGKGLKSARRGTPQTVSMDQKNFQFIPETLAIRAGDSVRFTSRDPETHNVRTTGRLASFNVNMPRGGEYVHKFDRGGGIRRPVRIGCVFHGAMRAWIYVFDHPHYQVTGTDGRFRLDAVPPGEYELEMFHPAGKLRSRRSIRIVAGQNVQIDIPVSPANKIGG